MPRPCTLRHTHQVDTHDVGGKDNVLKLYLRFLLMLLSLLSTTFASAQSIDEPSVEIRPAQAEVVTGDLLLVDVLIRNGSRIAGADIRLEMGADCLQIEQMTPGDYLPTTAETGGFAPRNAFDASSARLAANITNRQMIADGDGVFMRVGVRVLCASGAATLNITRAELVDESGAQITAASESVTLTVLAPPPAEGFDYTRNVESPELIAESAPDGSNSPLLIGMTILGVGAAVVGLMLWRYLR